MATREAIILAGGMGTRLAHLLKDLPKPMALVRGRPFLDYPLSYLRANGIGHTVLSVGYLGGKIRKYYGDNYLGMKLSYASEEQPLGTGGGLKNAMGLCSEERVVVLNGDSFFNCRLDSLYEMAEAKDADIVIALKRLFNFSRYGTVEVDDSGAILDFVEKQPLEEGLINTGIYLLRRNLLLQFPEDIFSFEREMLEQPDSRGRAYALEMPGYFIDIGVPEDYKKVQREIVYTPSIPKELNDYTLFFDRDGVLNRRIVDGYVQSVEEWEWLPGSLATLAQLRPFVKYMFLVTNQQGIGKGLFSKGDLEAIHNKMTEELGHMGGGFDGIYFCPDLATENPPCRKPNTGMAEAALRDFPDIRFDRSIMIGDSRSDMEFARNAGMQAVFVGSLHEEASKIADTAIPALADLPEALPALLKKLA